MSKKATRGRGRPAVYTGAKARAIVACIRKQGGLTQARLFLANTGVSYQPKVGGETVTEKIDISLPTLAKLNNASKNPVKLHRGRPAKAA